jgi:hypothetical protein
VLNIMIELGEYDAIIVWLNNCFQWRFQEIQYRRFHGMGIDIAHTRVMNMIYNLMRYIEAYQQGIYLIHSIQYANNNFWGCSWLPPVNPEQWFRIDDNGITPVPLNQVPMQIRPPPQPVARRGGKKSKTRKTRKSRK